MAALTKLVPRFLTTGRNGQNGLAGYLQRLVGGQGGGTAGIIGKATVASGQTSVTVSDTSVAAGDLFLVSVLTKGANACYFVGVANIVAGVSYDLVVNTDPGSGGVVLAVVRLPGNLLFAS